MKTIIRFCASTLLLALGLAMSQATLTPIMRGLHSPRGLTIGPDGTVYVAEAGRGGATPAEVGDNTLKFGLTGGVSMWRNNTQSRVVPYLPSLLTNENGRDTSVGPTNVDFYNGKLFVTFGWIGGSLLRTELGPVGSLFGTLTAFPVNNVSDYRIIGDLAAYETFVNPDKGEIDSDPYGLAIRGGQAFVADAAGNDVVAVGGYFPWTVDVLPGIKTTFNEQDMVAQPVPTSVTFGPDGALYVGILTGFPFPAGAAKVFRIDEYGNRTVYAKNLSSIIDIEFDKAGNLFVLQYSVPLLQGGPSSLIKIDKQGNRTTLISDMSDVTGFALGPGASIYLSSGAFHFNDGKVYRWTPD